MLCHEELKNFFLLATRTQGLLKKKIQMRQETTSSAGFWPRIFAVLAVVLRFF